MVVSIIDSGAGSVAVSARPTLPNTDSTSGKVLMILSVCCSISLALVIEMPGKVVGMYRRSPSHSGGMNSEPICSIGTAVTATSTTAPMTTGQRQRRDQFSSGV